MRKLSEDLIASDVPRYSNNHEYRVETHGPASTFYVHMTPEIRRMIEELKLGSSEGGFTPMYVPNADLPSAVVIYGSKALTLRARLSGAGYREVSKSNIPLEGRMQQES